MHKTSLLTFVIALLLGTANGWYWKKKGYNFWQYAFLGSIVAYVFIVKSIDFLTD